jgi:tripartite ATP-independent transporter DctM subunit
MVEALPVLMLGALILGLFSGLPVAVVLTGLGIGFSFVGVALGEMPLIALYNVPLKMWGSVSGSLIYTAVVMLLFMGVALEKSGIARELLRCMQLLFRRVPGGLALAVIVIGVILAPAAGLVGASVVTLTLIAMPAMLSRGYSAEVASGSIAAAGTVGIILPPAVMLFFLAGQFQVTIGSMFLATLLPGGILIGAYLLYYFVRGLRTATPAGIGLEAGPESFAGWVILLTRGLVLPLGLVALVLGSIIFGWATPRQSAALGAAGGIVLMALNGRLTWPVFKDVVMSTATLSAMVFFIIVAATVFSYPFVYFGGNDLIADGLTALEVGPWAMLAVILFIIFLLGFFIDWIEITVIFLPLFFPVLAQLDFAGHAPPGKMTMVWLATLIAMTLQTSFVTPPFGFALFFLKGAAPPGVSLVHIYRGIVPIVFIQLCAIALVLAWPSLSVWLPISTYGE